MTSRLYARACDWLQTLGVEREAVLREAGIETETMDSPGGLLTLEQVEAFVSTGVRLANQPGRVVEFGSALLFPSFGDMGLAALTAPTIEAVFDTTVRFIDLVTPLFRVEQDRYDDHNEVRVALRYGLSAEAHRIHVEVALSSLAAIVHTGASVSLEGFELDLPVESPRFVGWAQERGATVCTDKETMAFRFSSELAKTALALADQHSHERFVATCEESLAHRRFEDLTIRRVRGQLRTAGPPFPELVALSRTLGASPRTIRRHLEREGASYRELLDEARFTWAATVLRGSERNIMHIAYDLGYSTPESFTRAFRRTLGVSPTAYRNGHT